MVPLSLQLLQNCLMLINTLLVERTIEREGLWASSALKTDVHSRCCSTVTLIRMASL